MSDNECVDCKQDLSEQECLRFGLSAYHCERCDGLLCGRCALFRNGAMWCPACQGHARLYLVLACREKREKEV